MNVKDAIMHIKKALANQYQSGEIQFLQRELLGHFSNTTYIDLITKDYYFNELQQEQLQDALDKLQQYMPIQYITNKAYFYGSTFFVNAYVLIPRPETEELVELICKNHSPIDAVLDIGTGSGCIIISLAKHFSNADCFAVDNATDALNVAQVNATNSKLLNIRFETLDILEAWPQDLPLLDIIVSNPPYITTEETADMATNVLAFEPHNALFVNDHALEFYIRIVNQAKDALKIGGFLYFECNRLFAKDVVDIMLANGFEAEVKVDMAGNERFAIGKLMNR
jgi:release factor glutamine methyltransferase